MDLAVRKARLRARMSAQRRALDAALAAAAARAVADQLGGSSILAGCQRLAVYAAVGGELPSAALCELARARSKTLLFPRVIGDGLEFVACAPSDLEAGAYGVPAPSRERAAEPLSASDVVIAPALAFDAAGRRLGRGGGHYDRAFASGGSAAASLRVCVGYDFQRVSEVPAGPGDQRVHWIATEAGLWRTTEGESGIGESDTG